MIHIVYSCNKGYMTGLLMSVMSLVKYSNSPMTVYVLTADFTEENSRFAAITDEQIALLSKILQAKNAESRAIKLDVTKEYKLHLLNGANHENDYTPYAMLRLLLDFVPNLPDKLIYLDVDTMATGDIQELYDVDVDGFDFGATKDAMGRFLINRRYCNSGVLLLNMKKAKSDGLFEKCRKLVNKKKMLMPDQTVLNRFGKKKYLPFRFNEQRKIKPDTVIKHFCKRIVLFLPFGFRIYNIKQWQRDQMHKTLKIFQFDDIYEEFDKIKEENKDCF